MNPMNPFRVVVADPPWQFRDKLPGPGRGAEKHYPCTDTTGIVEAMGEMLKSSMAFDATLLLWRVASMQLEAFDVAAFFGFTVKSEIVWIKRTSNGKRHFGMGRQVRMEHEICLIATRGKGAPVKNKSVRSTFEAVASRKHSQKPAEFFRLVEDLYEGPYVELFARETRPGWLCLGNEVAS